MPRSAATPRPGIPDRPQTPPAVAVVVSRYNESITHALLEGALAEYRDSGSDPARVTVLHAPGAYELPAISRAAAITGRFAGVVALGCLIKGETRHDRYIAEAVAHGLVSITLFTGVPVAFGLLTVDTPQQARARAGGAKGNKGAEAMAALLDTIATIEGLSASSARTRRARPAKPDKAARAPRSPR